MKSEPRNKSKATTPKIHGFLATLLVCALLLSLCACAGIGSAAKTVTAKREAFPSALQTANDAAALALQQYIYARLKTEEFITADFTAMQPEEISAMVDEITALWQTAQQLTGGTERIADQALLVLEAPVASQTASERSSGFHLIPLVAKTSDYQAVQINSQSVTVDSKNAQKWAEGLTAQYDAIKGGQTIKQLAQQLGTDAKSAYAQLVMAQDLIRSGATADAAFYDKLTKIAQVTKTACKVGLFVTATVATGGGSLTALAGSSMTLAEGGAAIVGGVDCIMDVGATGSSIILGDNHQVTVSANNIKDKLAPVSAVVGLLTFDAEKTGESISYIGDTLTDWIYEGKILGVKVTGDSTGTQITGKQVDTSKVDETKASSAIEGMGFVPPEKQTATKTAVVDTYKISSEDVIAALDALKDQAKAIAKAAGVFICPTLDELVGSYNDGSLTFVDIYISDEVKAAAAAQSSDESESDSETGCDLAMLQMLESMKGQTRGMTLVIAKTGENTGTLTMLSQGGAAEGQINMGDSEPMVFTYSDGVLTFNYEVEGGLLAGSMEAAYGDNKAVTLNGALRSSSSSYGGEFYVDLLVQGSKLLGA